MKKILCALLCLGLTAPAFGAMSDADFLKLCKKGKSEEIAAALKDGANVNARDKREETPLMTAAAIRAGSAPPVPSRKPVEPFPRSTKPYLDTIIINADAQQTITWVRMPASLKRRLRSYPIAAPQAQAMRMRSRKSRFCAVVKKCVIYCA